MIKFDVIQIDPSTILVEDRMRKDFKPEKMKELIESIKSKGLINPITIEQKDNDYRLLAGERRLRACIELKLNPIPARVYRDVDDLDMREIELYENIHRDNLTPAEEAEAKLAIYNLQVERYGEKKSPTDTTGTSIRDVAKIIGESHANLARDLEMAKAMQAYPQLRNAKTKSEATQMIKKLKRKFTEHKAIERMEQRAGADPEHDKRKSLYNSYHLQDFFEGIKEVSDNIVDIVELDWPYGVDLKEVKKGDSNIDEYNEVDASLYPDFIKRTLTECYRVMKQNSWLVCWFAPEPWFETIYQTAINVGFTGRRLCGEWIKGTGQTMRPDTYLANATEWFFYFAKGQPVMHKPGRLNTFIYPSVSPTKKVHPTERPVEMIQDVLDTFVYPGTICLVPFLGSGNTMLAAYNLQMIGWGYDLSKEYQQSFHARIAEGVIGNFKSYGD